MNGPTQPPEGQIGKRPTAITIGLVVHVLCILWVLYAILIFFQRVTWRVVIFFAIFVLIHFIGIHGLRMKRKWARNYSMVIFFFYLMAQFGALNKAAKAGNYFGLIMSLLIGGFLFWLLNALNQSQIESYLGMKRKS